ncbi:uncharacterized protein FIESC28_08306 [Fusarium coffeatum]|uniref:Myb-like DNA-binding domain-containing protein n=1 Tax=Fusarium coffeatum TaxID=231269 RepID=A0A366R9Z1_9HYPO|nr:uncharacterized protein FIESC28_08306 [Fusarium coffeatum]RBR13120.1 hypothetical protein FIESC28_08306 [Fusarium coffeatum]
MADKREPTAAEAMLFFSIVKHTRNKADVDWNAVATEAGFKNADVAKVRFGQVKRKLGITTETTAPARTPATPKKPSRVSKTTTPRSVKAKGKNNKVKKEEESFDIFDDEDEEMAKPTIKDEGHDSEKTPEKEDNEGDSDDAAFDYPFFKQ